MYYQVMVPDNQQAFLKYLWWYNSKLPQNFVMYAHVFGGKSSASCSNYVLRRTAIDNESIFGKAASEVLQKNFYVDDLLKSSKDVESAKELVKNVMNMYKAGGFHLTKFISNSKELLLSIPERRRRIGVKDQDLSGQLPNKKALRICWEIWDDAFTFKIKLDERPLTKRVMLSVISSAQSMTLLDLLHHLYWKEEGFFRTFVKRMCKVVKVCNFKMLRFAMI